jgi:hypothetical protein
MEATVTSERAASAARFERLLDEMEEFDGGLDDGRPTDSEDEAE